MVNCYGIIVLDLTNKKTILVETPNNYLSFPKGKFEKKKDKTKFDCATRELYEETGINALDLTIIPDLTFDEVGEKSVCVIQYFVGIIKNHDGNFNFNFDPDEIMSVKWYEFDSIKNLPNLKQSRKNVFNQIRSALNFI